MRSFGRKLRCASFAPHSLVVIRNNAMDIYDKNKAVIEPILLATWLILIPIYYFTDSIEILLLFLLLLVFRLEFFWNTFVKIIEKPFGSLGNFFSILFVLSFSVPGLGIITWQIYIYLKNDEWNSVSLITGLKYLNNSWAAHPNDWEGLWNILNMVPLSVILLVLAATILFDNE